MSAYKIKGGKLQRRSHRTSTIAFGDLDRQTDIQVEGKAGQCVMIMANSNGRRTVEDLFPDVEWTTGHFFAKVHSSDWQFTHIKVTRLPPHFEASVPLAFASPDSLGLCGSSLTATSLRDGPRRSLAGRRRRSKSRLV